MKLSGLVLLLGLAGIQSATAQSVFNYTGSAQTYVVPAGAGGIQITATGAGGGGGGADENGAGGNGGAGATASGVYLAPAGTVITVTVGGGGGFGWTSNFGHACATSEGAGGGGSGGLAGGAGGEAGCSGWSGGGGGGGGASEVLVAGAPVLIAGGGGGGQGGSWNSTANPGQSSTAQGALVAGAGSAGAVGAFPGMTSDGGGGSGGGGGCPGGVGGPVHPDQSGAASGVVVGAGASCAAAAVTSFAVSGGGGAGGVGDVADTGAGPDPGGSAGGNGSVTLTPLYIVSGAVYADANHNGSPDAGETGTGISGLYVKMATYSAGACQSPALAAAAVNSSTGIYTLPALATGTYCVVLGNGATLGNLTPYVPAGWLGTQNPTGMVIISTAANAGLPVDFGLFNGSSAALTVFADTGAAGGTANDGVRNGGEPALGGVAVTAVAGGAPVATATTAGNGTALLWLPASVVGTTVTVMPTAPAGDVATGGSAGTSGGSYGRPAVTFTPGSGVGYTGLAFGLVPANAFAPTGMQTVQAGGTVFYPHTFTAGSAGSVSFTVTAAASPALAGWSEQLFLDAACSGVFAAGDPAITAPIGVTAGQAVCVLVKEFAPATAPTGAQNRATVSATLVYSGGAAPANGVMTLADTTTVVVGGGTPLVKQVQNLTLGGAYGTSNSALPGQTLQYQLTFTNDGSVPLGTVVVDDSTPAFTSFVKAQCPGALPTGLTACSVTTAPPAGGQGALQWTFSGSLAAGAQVTVTYQVTVAQ